MEELRSQKNLLLRSDIDIATTEAMINSRQQQEEEQVVPQGIEDLVQSMESIQMEGDLLQVRLEHRSEEDRLDTARRRLDENWSLGSCRGLDETSSLARNFSRDVPNNENDSSSSSPAIQPGLVSPQHTTDRLVRSLQVSVSVRAPPRPPVRASSLPSPPRPVTAASSSSSDEAWSQSWSQDTTTTASPRTMASNLVSLNSRLFQQRRRIGAAAVALVEAPATPPPANIPASDLAWLQLNPEDPTPFVDPDEEAITEDEESSLSSESSSDSDGTWGGTFSLRHTQSLRPSQSPPPGDASVVSRLTARTLTAVTDSLGVPEMLRPCFALEAARLQLTLALATHQSIGCDRNCEGEESDSDSESDWLASETDTDDDTAEEVEDQDEDARNSQSEADRDDASDDVAGGSELSDFSQRSWFVSQPDLGAPRVRPLSPSFSPPLTSSPTHSATSSSSWLPDSEDLRRMRQFLATDLDKVTDFNRSTASESEDD